MGEGSHGLELGTADQNCKAALARLSYEFWSAIPVELIEMKKFFFFRSSASSNGNNNPSDSRLNNQSTDKAENTFRSPRGSSKTRNQVFASQTSGTSPCLRRSLSFSSAVFHEDGLGQKNLSRFGDQNGSPCNSSTISHKRPDHRASRCRALTSERQSRPKCFETAVVQNANVVEKPGSSSSSRGYYDYLESSSNCSSNVSNKVVDRYIDGEEEQERSSPKSDPSQRNHIGNGAGKRPPRVQYTAPASPTDCMKEKPRSHSFRETKGTQPYFLSRDCVENGYMHESPRRIAKHVIERLTQSHVLPKTSSKEFGPDVPITIEDIYGVSLNRCPSLNADEVSQKGCPPDGSDETTNGYHHNEISVFARDNYGVVNSVEAEEDVDTELLRKSKEAEERFLLLSEELEEEDFLEDSGFSFGEPALIQKIRNITEERVSMAHEISAVLQAQIAQRASAREELRLSRAELDSQTRRLEKEKKELQSALEKELDRRSIDWSFKLEKYQTEEHRLRGLISVFPRDNYGVVNSVEAQEDVDAELLRKLKEAEERFLLLSEELEEEDFLEDSGFSFGEPALIQKIRNITEERVSMAHEISAVLQAQIAQRASAREELRLSRAELDSQTRRLEKEKKELQSALEKELDRRSSDWSFKLEKYQAEEHRLRGLISVFPRDNFGVVNSVEAQEDVDAELLRKLKEAEERFLLLSEELEEEDFLEDSGFSFGEPALIQKIRNITKERVSTAHEISAVLQAQIAQRALAREELGLSRAELDSQTRRLEKEKELQSALEKELDRRSSDWSFKLEKYQTEEHRLRGRVRELAEQNVSLQRDFSSLSERETESRSRFADSEKQLKDLTTRVEETDKENQNLRQNLFELQEKYRAAGEDQDCIRRNQQEKEKECKELHRSIARLIRTCSEQEKTIDGLQKGLSEEVERKASQENFDKQLGKLQMEQIRLTGVEQALRKEVESHRLEVDSLRHENINLLHRLKAGRKDGGFLAFKLDQELLNRVCCMQNQALPLLNESTQLCTKLLEYIKVKASQNQETKQGIEYMKNGLDGQLVVESDMKVHSFKRGTESLTRSLQTISVVLNEKSKLVVESHSHCLGDGSGHLVDQSSEDIVRSELKAETLLTSLLREKLYSKEVEVEQLQAELAAGVRGNDMLRCEVQNAMDNLSCMIHKMKDLELQMIKKDENVHRLQSELQECTKELAILKGILPKVSEERDLMWEEVKQYSERNMLLNSEVNVLKKKIEVLDEDVLLKEGQISILKDTLAKPFDLLGSPDSMQEFRW
ncbi:hypothetical protein CsSME_00000664 [Camellia sinensis var. sinensis]